MLSNSWYFTVASLRKLRQDRHAAACELIQRNYRLEKASSGDSDPSPDVDFLTVEEEQQYSFYIQLRIQNLCKILQFPAYVAATALCFFKRFYLVYSVMDYDPKVIFPTIVFLASKSENMHVTAEDMLKKTNQSTLNKEIMGEMELVIVKALKFQFLISHPYPALYGFFLEAQKLTDNLEQLYHAYKESNEKVHLSCLTDLPFFFSPSQIAYALFSESCTKYQIDLSRLLAETYSAAQVAQLCVFANEIQGTVENLAKVNKDEVTQIDRKLRFCHNPAFDPKSKLYAAIREQKEKRLEDSFLKKQAVFRKEKEDQDPF